MARPPQPPVMKYCIPMVITLEITQYKARPLGKDSEKKLNITGIIHSIIWLCDCCLGSVTLGWTIFCCAHMLTPTSNASGVSGAARFIHRKPLARGKRE